jgi:crotonobetainyl-CoA:carnitine CoA-transferase CaiB-like acyl-CoA transferase
MQLLGGVRIVSLATNLPGPLAVARLHSMGASVRKIEPPGGDLLQRSRPGWYQQLHEGVDVQRLDLKDPADRAKLNPLLQEADLLITATRPASLERMGLGWEELHRRFPRLAQVAIVGNPAPGEDLPGHDLVYQAEQGLVRPPDMPLTCLADLAGALEAVIAALQVVLSRRPGEPGRRVAVSLSAAAGWFAEPRRQGLMDPDGMLGGGFGGYRIYRTKEGWVAVAALEQHFQKALALEMGVPTLDPDALQQQFLTRTADEWAARARERDLPLVKIPEGKGKRPDPR